MGIIEKIVKSYQRERKDHHMTVYGIPLDNLTEEELKALVVHFSKSSFLRGTPRDE